VSSGHGIVAMGAGSAPVPCLHEAGRLELASPLEAAWNSLVESLILACGGFSLSEIVHFGSLEFITD
jgi:hypothetical protein